MPTYQYRCSSCGYEFEEFQSIIAEPIQTCPECGKSTQRVISGGIGLIFKGSGFYITDYKRKESGKSDSSGESAPKSEPKPEPKSDSKPKAGSIA